MDTRTITRILPGLVLSVIVGTLAYGLAHLIPLVGAPVIAIIAGALLRAFVPGIKTHRWEGGIAFASRPLLQTSIVVLGATLSLTEVARVGANGLPVMLITLLLVFAMSFAIGRRMNVTGDTHLLITVGTAICGASAIAATTGVIKAKQSDVAYAIGTIFTFNVAAVLLFPPLGHAMSMTGSQFGLWAGTTINDMSSVVAASSAFGHGALAHGVVVKLTRVLMLIPIILVIAFSREIKSREIKSRELNSGQLPWRKLVPPFLIAFIVFSALNSLGLVPDSWRSSLTSLSAYLIAVALAGIGLSLEFDTVRAAGFRPLVFGGILWLWLAISSLVLQRLFSIS